jgi:hypothetical protein
MVPGSFTPSGVMISPPTHDPRHAATLNTRPARRRRASLGKDVAIGVAIAALVLGIAAVVKFVVLADDGGPRRAEAVAAGTIVITAPVEGRYEVFVGEESRGWIEGGQLTLERIAAGEAHRIRVVGDGIDPCARTIELTGGQTETIACQAVAAPAGPAEPPATDDQGAGATAAEDDPVSAPSAEETAAAGADAGAVPSEPAEPAAAGVAGDAVAEAEQAAARQAEERRRREERAAARRQRAVAAEAKAEARPRATPSAATGADDVGYLVAYSTPWAKVLIDGKDTGKMTPIAPRAKIALPPGKHKVTFVVGRESWSYTVTITAGETSKLTKDLPVTAP